MRIRIAVGTAVAALALAVVGAPTAGAASANGASPQFTDAGPLMTIPMTGVAKTGKTFRGHYGIYRFVAKNGKVWAVGTLTGKLKGRHVRRGNVMMPASVTGDSSSATTSQSQSCTVLHLVLGPINLNLLGLRVTLGGGTQANQPIVLDITAQQGAGLLGDLLCGIDNTLGSQLGQIGSQLQQLASALNSIAALLGGLQAA